MAVPSDPEQWPGLQKSTLDFPVVGMGASAGGLAALQRFFDHMPSQSGMAFVVVLHLSPQHPSSADAILQRHTRMAVVQVTGPVPVQPDHIYIIPPNQDLLMNDGRLELRAPVRVHGPHVAIDLFFRTLAHVQGSRALGVVLSGTGADGAVGLKRIKEKGGVALVQAPDDAEFAEMPSAAIATGAVDFVLPVADMPQRLLDLWNNARRIWLPETVESGEKLPSPPSAADAQRAEKALQDVMALLRLRTGHDFRHYKRATMLRRIERRMQVCEVPDLNAYCEHLRTHAEETGLLLQDMLISVTNFFRDREAFEALEREAIAPLLAERAANEPLRAWVAGCATGEEAYSLSILLHEAAQRRGGGGMAPAQVFATDIDERALALARTGLYGPCIATDVAPERLAQYFTCEPSGYRVGKAVREPVLFAAHNVLRDPAFSRLDLICCRNLLIYVSSEAQLSILEMFRFALRPGGYLFLGTSESADAAGELFTVVDKKNRIYQANPRAPGHGVRHLPLSALSGPDRRHLLPQGPVLRESSRAAVAELHARAICACAPPSLLADHRLHILHLSDGAARYLQQGGGPPTAELLASVHPDLRIELRTALFQVAQIGQAVRTRSIHFEHGGVARHIRLAVTPVPAPAPDTSAEPHSAEPLMLVVFEDAEQAATAEHGAAGDSTDRQLIGQLEAELDQLKSHLRNTVEHAGISTEELKASNEELQAINEELRSATEELETSKEELQSMNEELITVNYELKTRVEEASKTNDDLQNFLASTDIATLFIDEAMRIKRFTPQVARLFNVIASDVGRALQDITHRLDYDDLAQDLHSVLQDLRTVERPVRSLDARHYLARLRPYRTVDNKIAGAVLAFVDVTELRQAEQRVRASEERLRLAALTTRDYIIVTLDDDGLITSWNEGARRVFGYQDQEVLGQHIRLIFTPEDCASGVPEDEMRRARETGRAEDERWHLRKDGSIFYCSGVMTQLRDSSVSGFVKIARDMTGSKTQEAEREAMLEREKLASSEARAANELKDQFLAVMSHELKHPLNLIQVSTELLARLPELQGVAMAQRASDNIRSAVRSQAKLIDDLLDLSRVRTGKLQLNLEAVAVEAVAAIVEIAGVDAQRKGVALHWVCEAPELQLWCDRVRTEQIVWNLLHNALKFTPTGGSVTVALAQRGAFAQLTVADTGVGIAPEFLSQVFGLFSQGGAASARRGGLGIGLALVQELSSAQGGEVSVVSDGLGKGTTFTVLLPLVGGGEPRAEAAAAASALQGLRVLLVDDMEDALLLFAVVLENEGADVDTASSGAAALDLAALNTYDLLISDIGMPGMDGYALLAALRQMPGHGQVRAIAMTGYGRNADAERARREGFDAHVTKPVDFDALRKTVAGLQLRAAGTP
ncbi:chemotaxis protein, partial [Rhodococcus sp. SRB_17]|nr:chemotaxis protein [Rhodococcus sp. SRB_17]